MWFNVEQARSHLLEKGFVLTLRPKALRGPGRKTSGYDVLMYKGFGKKGNIFFCYVTFIRDPAALDLYSKYSGFTSLSEWQQVAGDNRHLFLVVLLDRPAMHST